MEYGNHTTIVEYADVPWISSKTSISLSIFGVTLNDKCPTTRILLQLVLRPPAAAQHNLEILEDTYVHNVFTLFLLETGFSPITEQTLLAVTPSPEYQHWRGGTGSFAGIKTTHDDRITHIRPVPGTGCSA